MTPSTVPDIVFHTRVRNEALGGPNPFEWKDVSSADLFAGKTVVLFAVPGAFTPACSDSHLPGFERRYDEFRALGVDGVYCLAVNDAFVLFQWAKSRDIEKVVMLPDGNGEFSRLMGMLVQRTRQGMGLRSWRYSMLVKDWSIQKVFAEPGFRDEPQGVGVQVSDADTMLGLSIGVARRASHLRPKPTSERPIGRCPRLSGSRRHGRRRRRSREPERHDHGRRPGLRRDFQSLGGRGAAPAPCRRRRGRRQACPGRQSRRGRWDRHDDTAETVVVWSGTFDVAFRDHTISLTPGQCCVVPLGADHQGTSSTGAEVILFKSAT